MDELLEGVAEKHGLKCHEIHNADSVVIVDPSNDNRVLYQVWFRTDVEKGKITSSRYEFFGLGSERDYADLARDIEAWELGASRSVA